MFLSVKIQKSDKKGREKKKNKMVEVNSFKSSSLFFLNL